MGGGRSEVFVIILASATRHMCVNKRREEKGGEVREAYECITDGRENVPNYDSSFSHLSTALLTCFPFTSLHHLLGNLIQPQAPINVYIE